MRVLVATTVAAAVLAAAAGPLASQARGPGFEVVRLHRNPNDVRFLEVREGRLLGVSRAGTEWALDEAAVANAFHRPGPPLIVDGVEEASVTRLGEEAARGSGRARSVAGYPVTAVTIYRGGLHLATFGGGLFREDGGPVAGTPADIRDLEVAGGLLVMGHGGGLALTDGRLVRHVRLEGPPGDDVSSLAWDGRALWVGYFDGGLARLAGGAWEQVPTPGPPGAAWINTLHWDGRTLWVGSEAGLGRWNPERGAVARVEGFEGRVQSIREEGEMLVVTGPERVAIAGPEGWETLELPNEALRTACVHLGALWAGGMRGVLHHDDGKWRRYSELNGRLPDSWVTALLPVGDEIWAGTYDAGLLALPRGGEARMLRPEAWVNFDAMARSGDLVAVGTMGDGLLLHDAAARRWRRITTREGLPSDDVTAVLFQGETLWAGTRSGLAEVRVSPTGR